MNFFFSNLIATQATKQLPFIWLSLIHYFQLIFHICSTRLFFNSVQPTFSVLSWSLTRWCPFYRYSDSVFLSPVNCMSKPLRLDHLIKCIIYGNFIISHSSLFCFLCHSLFLTSKTYHHKN